MAIFDLHHPLILVFGILGNVVSTGVYFAPLPTFIEICKKKSTMGFQALPYVVTLFSAMLWLYYALIKQGDTFLLITINALGSLIEVVYVIIFIVYATPCGKKQTFKILDAAMVLCILISLGSFIFLDGSIRALVVGWFCVAISVCVFASPLTIVFKVVKTKSVEFMPLILSFFLTLSAIMWFSYGMLTKDICVTVPNVLGIVLGIFQMALYQYYKSKSKVPSIPIIKLPEQIININLSNTEVVPVDSSRSSGSDVEVVEKKDEEGGNDGGLETMEQKKRAVSMMVDDDEPYKVEIVNVKPTLVVCAA
ncbi:bidirectional sugar transporter SWEET15-like [Rutidosis leptorrhynchoides]|uniref:bidirectional sugar transporter SWEET15-like n=1 Tax=Rutidosis leptorrhynchoides TaxID=125765 RepID=UPI003A9A00D9